MQCNVEKKQLGSLFMLANKSNLCFSYENLERATDYFSDKNKLGQGGSGSVFKVSCVVLRVSSLDVLISQLDNSLPFLWNREFLLTVKLLR